MIVVVPVASSGSPSQCMSPSGYAPKGLVLPLLLLVLVVCVGTVLRAIHSGLTLLSTSACVLLVQQLTITFFTYPIRFIL